MKFYILVLYEVIVVEKINERKRRYNSISIFFPVNQQKYPLNISQHFCSTKDEISHIPQFQCLLAKNLTKLSTLT